jgi:AGCS family alanine or glycine:cation symporter
VIYIAACLYVILVNAAEIPAALVMIIRSAFSPDAAYGGFMGCLVTGIRRAAFSNEAGIGSAAMAKELSWFPYVLGLTVFLFSYSSMISWSYYGERCWTWLFGERVVLLYRLLFLAFTFLGSIVTATNILEFSDLMVLGMAFPNILGAVLLSGVVARSLAEYRRALAAGEVKPRA